MAEDKIVIAGDEDLPPPIGKVEVAGEGELPPPPKKKYRQAKTITIEIGWFYLRINGRRISIRNPFYTRD